MGKFIRRYFLTIIFILITAGISYWSWTSYSVAMSAMDSLSTVTQVAQVIRDTATPVPTQSAPIPLPEGNQPFTWNPDTKSIYSSDGQRRFALYEGHMWVPIIPDEILSSGAISGTVILDTLGNWILFDRNKKLAFQWDVQDWLWKPPADSRVVVQVNPDDIDNVMYLQGSSGIIQHKTSEDILEAAPELVPSNYSIDATPLHPWTVVWKGTDGREPYVIYTDSTGTAHLGWDPINERIEHIDYSQYRDETTGLTIHTLLITDRRLTEREQVIFRFQEQSREILSKVLFEYTLSLNYFYTNYHDEFIKMIPGMYSSSTTIWRALGNLNSRQIEKLRLTAQEKLLNDLTTLNSQSYLTTQIGMSELLNFNRQDVWFIFRLLPGNLDGRTFFSEKPSEAFRASYSLYTIQVAPTNTVEVNVSFTRNPRIVGGILTEILREITAGGANATTYKASSRYRTYASSTSDSMMIQLCGEDVIETYWQEIPYTYRSMKVVPRLDDVTDTAPVCVLEEVNR